MNTVKVLVFLIGIFLINIVVGFPYDMRNLFITHTIFFVPYILEFHKYLIIKFDKIISWIIRFIYTFGVFILFTNISGILGIIEVDKDLKSITFSDTYALPFSFSIDYYNYILIAGISYSSVFISVVVFEHLIQLQKDANKEPSSESAEIKRSGVVKHVSNG
ncbi:hypothetical protein CSV79_11730 [Sporosarcina sp. P13]|uniref:hypothetical protein n=1 Tax=Sporosarcina sp. P13 TaxID=2048263 RepID=UPI000C162815|nr:hypothetical protein [Sporosarcina sp. P13]PIC63458.1 hypothetical protein CSV79_11730 [Sporosarcina sp. P13]